MTEYDDDVSGDLGGQYLKKEDLVSGPLLLTIASVTRQTFEARAGKPPEAKWVITFAGEPTRKMGLNKTNLSILAKAYGRRATGWNGQRIEVYLDEGVMFAGRLTGGMRVRPVRRAETQDNGFGEALPAI
jgi:hypothetical protein